MAKLDRHHVSRLDQADRHCQKLLDDQDKAHRAELDQTDMELGQARQINATLGNTIADLEKAMDNSQTQIRSLQSSHFRSIEPAQWMATSISEINSMLTDLMAEVKQWGERYVRPDFHAQLASAQSVAYLEDRMVRRGVLLGPEFLWHLEKGYLKKKGAAMLLSAAATVDIARAFGDPFFAFTGPGDTDSRSLGALDGADGLHRMINWLMRGEAANAHSWRCQTIRYFDPPATTSPSKVAELKELASRGRKSAASDFADDCIADVKGILIPVKAKQDASIALCAIAQKAADMAWSFWAQKTFIKVVRLNALNHYEGRPDGGPILYRAASRIMEAAPSHTIDLDDDPTALDGREVLLLSSPAIVAYGDVDGLHYDTLKVWKKAVVVLAPPQRR
ncbi:hypothetical protein LTR36_007366 [Oleoguttula mirabilis]|uniref:Uncharacterized protein n=1 Tax=Oleoguttula mirabilis TaxID=1507867 RepID=A0AAV9JA56_9PEZI|nr:hypothetical protein LTR36_007366 [Oleoguttula mirabilis]